MFSNPACLARHLASTLLDGRDDAAEYVVKFDSNGAKSTKRVAKETENRSRAVLQNVDADTIEAMFKNMERTYRPGVFDSQGQDRYATLVSRTACPAPEGRAPPTAPVRGTEGWMSFLCPGAGKVEGMGDIAVNKWLDRLSWIAIYRHPEALTEHLKTGHRQMTKSQKWRLVPAKQQTNSCHQTLAFVLKWQWGKHFAITGIEPPASISVFCDKCADCSNARECTALSVLESWAREQSEKCLAGEALPPGLSGAASSSFQLVQTTQEGVHPDAASSGGLSAGAASHGAAAAPPAARRAASSTSSSSSSSTSGQ